MSKRAKLVVPTRSDYLSSELSQVAVTHWGATPLPYNQALVDRIYSVELSQAEHSAQCVLLEFSGYLEQYLWKHFSEKVNDKHVMSLLMMINEKQKENVDVWPILKNKEKEFRLFLKRVFQMDLGKMQVFEKMVYITFLTHLFQSLEDELVRSIVLDFVSVPLWANVSDGYFANLLNEYPEFSKLVSQRSSVDPRSLESQFFVTLLNDFLTVLSTTKSVESDKVNYLCRMLVFFIDLLCQLKTRRFIRCFLEDKHVYATCRLSPLVTEYESRNSVDTQNHEKIEVIKEEKDENHSVQNAQLFSQLLDMFHMYLRFEMDESSGQELPEKEVIARHYRQVQRLQRISFKHFVQQCPQLAMGSIASIDSRASLQELLEKLSVEELANLCILLKIHINDATKDRSFLQEVLLVHFERRTFQKQLINSMPLYPSERVLFDKNIVPEDFTSDQVFALPKLNLQFLTFHDYLLRNFNLFRLESTYQIRQDVCKALERINPVKNLSDKTVFTGWSRMAIPISTFSIIKVKKPALGESNPEQVLCEVGVNLSAFNGNIRQEWEEIKRHDVLFLMQIDATAPLDNQGLPDISEPATPEELISLFRGSSVIDVLDETRKVIGAKDDSGTVYKPAGSLRIYRIALDPAQYAIDAARLADQHSTVEDYYSKVNLLLRRPAKENNFKAVLETIRDLMNSTNSVPPWLQDVILGYGDPSSASWFAVNGLTELKMEDTFLDAEHVVESFPNSKVIWKGGSIGIPPYKISFQLPDRNKGGLPDTILVESYLRPVTHGVINSVRFTPAQVHAIVAGTSGGLSTVIGPPGTGKTDVAVQILVNLYHNCPNQRTLLVTHSNAALNDLFEKLVTRNLDPRYLLRLGHGEKLMEQEVDFGKFGRVNHMLERRLACLEKVTFLARSMGLDETAAANASNTCETAVHFRTYCVRAMEERWRLAVDAMIAGTEEKIQMDKLWPFTKFFNAKFSGDFAADVKHCEYLMLTIDMLFQEVEECRPFELLRNFHDRGNFLILRHAKIIAMTCTHAALKRRDLLDLGFQYDNILMEEAAQILEIETFVPMLLQNMDKESGYRLKRVILIGDHKQLPPVVKNRAFSQFSRLDQSMFARLIRLGTPAVQLNIQGRSRSEIANLFRWRYSNLGDFKHTTAINQESLFNFGNAGFAYNFQFVNVDDYQGKGEFCPVPYFYQNLGEAEYVVHVFMYMRLLGYPASSISIITTYNGQKHLIRDVLERRCGSNPMFGRPSRVTTVDKYQGQQNQYILLSLVRTRAVGHLRDVRRLVVSMSRARLGLYVFGRAALFRNCYELAPTMDQFSNIDSSFMLKLVPGEVWPCSRLSTTQDNPCVQVRDVTHIGQIVIKMTQLANEHQQELYHKNLIAYEESLKKYESEQLEFQKKNPQISNPTVSTASILSMHSAASVLIDHDVDNEGGEDDVETNKKEVDLSNIVNAVSAMKEKNSESKISSQVSSMEIEQTAEPLVKEAPKSKRKAKK